MTDPFIEERILMYLLAYDGARFRATERVISDMLETGRYNNIKLYEAVNDGFISLINQKKIKLITKSEDTDKRYDDISNMNEVFYEVLAEK